MKLARRDIFKLAGGAAAGTVLTPVPWKLLNDTAEWSQNWSWIPKLPRGESKTKFTACTLCPAGCGLRARCVGDQPVSLSGIAGHPLSRGVLCPVGIGGHHVAFQAGRVLRPLMRVMGKNPYFAPVTLEAAVSEISSAIAATQRDGAQRIAVFDERPGRSMSLLYRRFVARIPNGTYLVAPDTEEGTLRRLETMTGAAPGTFGIDLENTRTLLSFGAPVLDGWATPGRIMERRRSTDNPLFIIQAEPRQSNTAAAADQWLPIRPGTDAALALGLAHVLLRDRLADADVEYRALVNDYTPEFVASTTGVEPAVIVNTAHRLAANRPTVVVAGGDAGGGPVTTPEQTAIAGLNSLLGGIVVRNRLPVPDEFANIAPENDIDEIPDHTIRVLILGDAHSGHALPWDVLKRKLSEDGSLVVSLSPYLDLFAQHANYIIPASAHLESIAEVVTPPCSRVAFYALSAPLLKPPSGAVPPEQFLSRLSGETMSSGEAMKQQVAAIYATKRGEVFQPSSGKSTPLTEIASAGDLWKALIEGGCWSDDASSKKPDLTSVRMNEASGRPRLALEEDIAKAYPLILLPYGWRGATESSGTSPIMTKVFQESGLRATEGQARIHPKTAQQYQVANGDRVTIETRCGRSEKQIWHDPAVMPGVIEAPVAPQAEGLPPSSILEICAVDTECTWRLTRARILAISRRQA